MSNDVTIQPASAQAGVSGTSTTVRAAAQSTSQAAADSGMANPTLRLDPALGIVVIEFRTTSGQISGTIPTERQLEAYRANALSSSSQPQVITGAGGPPAAWFGMVT